MLYIGLILKIHSFIAVISLRSQYNAVPWVAAATEGVSRGPGPHLVLIAAISWVLAQQVFHLSEFPLCTWRVDWAMVKVHSRLV